MKGNSYKNNDNFSFNDKETFYNPNAYQTHEKLDQDNERQKQLSEIREMIAKTYKVVG